MSQWMIAEECLRRKRRDLSVLPDPTWPSSIGPVRSQNNCSTCCVFVPGCWHYSSPESCARVLGYDSRLTAYSHKSWLERYGRPRGGRLKRGDRSGRWHRGTACCSMGGGWRFETTPGRMLKDALWAGVVDELPARDQSFPHRHLAPGAEPVWEVGLERIRIRM